MGAKTGREGRRGREGGTWNHCSMSTPAPFPYIHRFPDKKHPHNHTQRTKKGGIQVNHNKCATGSQCDGAVASPATAASCSTPTLPSIPCIHYLHQLLPRRLVQHNPQNSRGAPLRPRTATLHARPLVRRCPFGRLGIPKPIFSRPSACKHEHFDKGQRLYAVEMQERVVKMETGNDQRCLGDIFF